MIAMIGVHAFSVFVGFLLSTCKQARACHTLPSKQANQHTQSINPSQYIRSSQPISLSMACIASMQAKQASFGVWHGLCFYLGLCFCFGLAICFALGLDNCLGLGFSILGLAFAFALSFCCWFPFGFGLVFGICFRLGFALDMTIVVAFALAFALVLALVCAQIGLQFLCWTIALERSFFHVQHDMICNDSSLGFRSSAVK